MTHGEDAEETLLKYDIGAGDRPLAGYLPLDSKDLDVRKGFPMEDKSVEALNLSHVLEHVEYNVTKFVVQECHRVLRSGGVVDVYVPNGRAIGLFLLFGLSRTGFVKTQGYGSQINQWQYHKNVFTAGELRKLFEDVGFRRIVVNGSDKSRRQGGKGAYQKFSVGRILTLIVNPELHLRGVK